MTSCGPAVMRWCSCERAPAPAACPELAGVSLPLRDALVDFFDQVQCTAPQRAPRRDSDVELFMSAPRLFASPARI
jgi:hypothetical protein